MKNVHLTLYGPLLAALIACGGGGGGGGGGETAKYQMDTGSINTTEIIDSEGNLEGYQLETPDGPIELFFDPNDNSYNDTGTAEFVILVDGEPYELANARFVGWTNLGGVSSAGWDGADEPFAMAEALGDVDNFSGHADIGSEQNFEFSNISYYYTWVKGDTLDFNDNSLEGSDGVIQVRGDQFIAKFFDDESQVVLRADIDGKELQNGTSRLTVSGEVYPGDLQGLIFTEAVDDQLIDYTGGAFVSSDNSDEVLYSGAWGGYNYR